MGQPSQQPNTLPFTGKGAWPGEVVEDADDLWCYEHHNDSSRMTFKWWLTLLFFFSCRKTAKCSQLWQICKVNSTDPVFKKKKL